MRKRITHSEHVSRLSAKLPAELRQAVERMVEEGETYSDVIRRALQHEVERYERRNRAVGVPRPRPAPLVTGPPWRR
jgi:Arc/MetJ-type ribon-helix-helix transcriptional regulator